MKCVRLPFVLLALLACAQLAGPWCWNTAAGGEVIRQGVLIPYEITGPDGWIYDARPHKYVLGVFRPEAGALYPYISLTVIGGAMQMNTTGGTVRLDVTPEDLVEDNLYSRPGARLLSRRWLGEGDNEFLLTEFSWSSVLGEIRCIKAFHTVHDSVLVVTAVCLAAEYDGYQPTFLETVMSVRIKNYLDEEARKKSEPSAGEDAWLHND
jgi:hypothetical protein